MAGDYKLHNKLTMTLKDAIGWYIIGVILLAVSTAFESSVVANWMNWHYLAGVMTVILYQMYIEK